MKCLAIVSLLVVSLSLSTMARPQQSTQYGVPVRSQVTSFDEDSSNKYSPDFMKTLSKMEGLSKVFKHISIHVPPPEEFDETPMKRVIRPMEKPDKVVSIIFIKAPNPSSSRQTEIILPSQPETKTVVYVLVKKSSSNDNVKIRQQSPTKPPRPEVFFIKYGRKNQENQNQQGSTGVSAGTSSNTDKEKGGY